MRKIILGLTLALTLGGCASLQRDIQVISGVKVSAQQIVVAANAFDIGEATATQYLIFCKKTKPAPSICALATRRDIVSAVRTGRAARNQLEPYIASGSAGPVAIYNTLVSVIASLKSNIPGVSK